ICSDFSNRSHFENVVFDVLAVLESIKYLRKRTAGWMKPDNRGAKFPLNLLGAKAQVFYQPLGVVGIMSPWNFPSNLIFSPLANTLSAGNRALLKPSDLTPVTSALIAELVAKYFSAEEVDVVTGGPEAAAAFSAQAFDHLIFTGAPSIAKHVMRAAADNLVPLTLELGGKCPVVIGAGADLKSAVEKVMTFKTLNAGQICLAPDYTFMKKEQVPEFVELCKKYMADTFGNLSDNDDYCSIINPRHRARIVGYINDAESRGAEIVPLSDDIGMEKHPDHHKLAPMLVIDPAYDSKIMTEEIFGPAMPIKTYDDISEVIAHVNAGERPLALYYFGSSSKEVKLFRNNTTSGGMVVNDVASHILQDNLPFGGVGNSGMGAYHGFDGFRQLSHAKAYYKQGVVSLTPFLKAPRTNFMLKVFGKMMG
ncbi:MAG: aldehyde dehydrogenase family protein, partial [Spongiibacteraceae bacterium]